MTLKVYSANYNWGEFSLGKKVESDVIKYTAAGKIDSVITVDANGRLIRSVRFTYGDHKITLNTLNNDEYDLDNEGRVVYHSDSDTQQGIYFVNIQRYGYDANGYLNKATMSLNANGQVGPVFSTMDYEVENGNYTKFTLQDADSTIATRQYTFTYNLSKKVNSPCAFFSPVLANEAYSNIDKYLNYGKASVNLLTGINYSIKNLNSSISKGSLQVVTNINSNSYITSLALVGNTIPGFGSDEISPLPRSVSFTLK